MCGINGIISNESIDFDQLIGKMNLKIQHRGPNASGSFVNSNMALGHVRLSIIDLSHHANQPFSDDSNDYQLVYNGEVYNFIELQKKHNLNCT